MRNVDDLSPHEQARIAANMYVAMTNDTRPITSPPVTVPEPPSWLRVEIHFSAVLLFYGTLYGLCGLMLLISIWYGDHRLSFNEKLMLAPPFIIGPFVIAGIDWLRLKSLGWFTRKLWSKA